MGNNWFNSKSGVDLLISYVRWPKNQKEIKLETSRHRDGEVRSRQREIREIERVEGTATTLGGGCWRIRRPERQRTTVRQRETAAAAAAAFWRQKTTASGGGGWWWIRWWLEVVGFKLKTTPMPYFMLILEDWKVNS